MLVEGAGKLAIDMLDVVIAVEDDRALRLAQQCLTQLRRAGFSAEIVAGGSPRKRFDKAVKMDARALLSFTHDDDQGQVVRALRGPDEWVEKIDAIVLPLVLAQGQ